MTNPSEFQTPLPVVEYMCSLVPDGSKKILEPTPGDGNIVRELRNRNFNVTAPADFFALAPGRFDCVVMNPPFSPASGFNLPAGFENSGLKLGYHILYECMERSGCVIALMPWFTIVDSDVRTKQLMDWGLRSVTSLPRKTFQYTRIQTVVLELQQGWRKKTEFKLFNF